MTTAFERATAVRALGVGRYATDVSGGWGAPVGPNGGYVAAIVLRAMLAALDGAPRRPRSLTLHYLGVARPGAETVVEVAVERAGRGVTTLAAHLRQGERTCVSALGAFATDVPATTTFSAQPAPEVPRPQALEPIPWRSDSPFTLLGRLDLRQTFGPPPFGGADEGVTGGWTALAEPQPLDPCVLALYADAWWPSAWARLSEVAPAPTIDLTIHFRDTPDPGDGGPVLARFESRTATEGFFEEDGQLWSTGGALLVQSRQLALLRDAAPSAPVAEVHPAGAA